MIQGFPIREEQLVHVTMERHTNNLWSLVVREGVLGPTLFEAYECLMQLSAWRRRAGVL